MVTVMLKKYSISCVMATKYGTKFDHWIHAKDIEIQLQLEPKFNTYKCTAIKKLRQDTMASEEHFILTCIIVSNRLKRLQNPLKIGTIMSGCFFCQ